MLGRQAAGEHRQRATLRGGSPRRGRATSPTAHPAHGAQPVRPKSPRSTNLSRSSSCEDTRTLSSLEDGVRHSRRRWLAQHEQPEPEQLEVDVDPRVEEEAQAASMQRWWASEENSAPAPLDLLPGPATTQQPQLIAQQPAPQAAGPGGSSPRFSVGSRVALPNIGYVGCEITAVARGEGGGWIYDLEVRGVPPLTGVREAELQ